MTTTTTTTTDTAADADLRRALSTAYDVFYRARAAADRALFARGGHHSTHAAAIVDAYAAFDRARAAALANDARAAA
jgi:hypothetical protein